MGSGVFTADERKCVFIHVPKTAGSSVSNALGIIGLSHLSINWFPESYFSFCFVRNPWDRVVSAFSYLSQGGSNLLDKFNSMIYLSKYQGQFERFVKGELGENDSAVFHQMHFRPQYKYVCDKDGKIAVDFVGKYENLEEDFGKIHEELGFSVKNGLPRLNQSEHGHYKDYYTERTKEIVGNAYKKDIELFDYGF